MLDIFTTGAMWCTPAVILLFVLVVALRLWLVARRILSHLSGGSSGRAGGLSAGNGRTRIGPRD
jgi:hypothetical protein